MGQQIGISLTKNDETELFAAIRNKYTLLSVPRFFEKDKGIPKPLGEYVGMDQKIVFESDVNSILENTHQIKNTNWETMVETLTKAYHLYSKEAFYLEWNTSTIEKWALEIHNERMGKLYLTVGRVYLLSLPRNDEKYKQLKALFLFVVRQIKKSSPYMSDSKIPHYIGKEMSQLILAEKVMTSFKIVKNPVYKSKI